MPLVQAVRIHEDGGPDVLVHEEVADPEPGRGEVLIRLRASALNHLDVWIRKGLPSVPKPRILGADGAGIVEALGEGVDGFAPGGRIVVCGATSGPNPPAALHRIWWKQLTILGSTMGTKEDFDAVYELVASGRARPVVDEVFPLAEIRAAHERLEAGEQLGKIVLSI